MNACVLDHLFIILFSHWLFSVPFFLKLFIFYDWFCFLLLICIIYCGGSLVPVWVVGCHWDGGGICQHCPQHLTLLPCVQMLARGGTGAVDPTEGGGAGGEHSRVCPAAQLPAQVSTGAHEHPLLFSPPSSPPCWWQREKYSSVI